MKHSTIVGSVALLTMLMSDARAQRWPQEPSYDVIRSSSCVVPVCTDVDFGDFTFRYYSRGRASTIRMIPKGRCACEKVVSGDRDFNGSIRFDVETMDGRTIVNAALLRKFASSHPKATRSNAAETTTLEGFDRQKTNFEKIEGFTVLNRNFDGFQVWRERNASKTTRSYYFIPTSGTSVRVLGHEQLVAFHTPLGWPNRQEAMADPSYNVAAQIRISNNVLYHQFFSPRQHAPGEWIERMQAVLPVVEERLLAK